MEDYGLYSLEEAPLQPLATDESTFPAKVSLAMAYVPYQRFENLYDNEKALERGTLFEALDMPFYGRKRGQK